MALPTQTGFLTASLITVISYRWCTIEQSQGMTLIDPPPPVSSTRPNSCAEPWKSDPMLSAWWPTQTPSLSVRLHKTFSIRLGQMKYQQKHSQKHPFSYMTIFPNSLDTSSALPYQLVQKNCAQVSRVVEPSSRDQDPGF